MEASSIIVMIGDLFGGFLASLAFVGAVGMVWPDAVTPSLTAASLAVGMAFPFAGSLGPVSVLPAAALEAPVSFSFAVASLGLLNFLIYSGAGRVLLALTLGKRISSLKLRKWISTIPGNPTCLDPLLAVTFGSFPELNDNGAILPFVDTSRGPVLLHGAPPKGCRYWGIQAFLARAKSHKPAQCLRDSDIKLNSQGLYTVVLSTLKEKPAWVDRDETVTWLPLPDNQEGTDSNSNSSCSLCLRAFCLPPGESFRCPDVYMLGASGLGTPSSNNGAAAEAMRATAPLDLDDQVRTGGGWAAQQGSGATHRRLIAALGVNLLLLLAVPALTSAFGDSALSIAAAAATVVAWGALLSAVLYQVSMILVTRRYRALLGNQKLVPNETVLVPDPKGELKGHPCHLYYTMVYDATKGDVRIKGTKKGNFAYSSVTCYDWHSLPPPDFKYDDTLLTDAEAAEILARTKSAASKISTAAAPASAICRSGNGSGGEDGENNDGQYTVFLTASPTCAPHCNEIDVSASPTGVCLVRLIYPSGPDEIARCTPKVKLVERGNRAIT